MDINQLVSKSGDSQLLDYTLSNGVLRLLIISPDFSEEVISIAVPTRSIIANVPNSPDAPHRTCFIELLEVCANVECNVNGIVVPSADFGTMMRQIRDGFSLVFGSRLADFPFLFRVTGARPLIVCPVASVSDIRCETNN